MLSPSDVRELLAEASRRSPSRAAEAIRDALAGRMLSRRFRVTCLDAPRTINREQRPILWQAWPLIDPSGRSSSDRSIRKASR